MHRRKKRFIGGRGGFGPRTSSLWLYGACLAAALSPSAKSLAQALKVQTTPSVIKPHLVCVLCSLKVTASPSLVTFTLVSSGVALGSAPITIVTTLSGVASIAGTVTVFAYFATPASALTGTMTATNVIPASSVLGQDSSGIPTTYTAFTQNGPAGAGGGSLTLFTQTSVVGLLLPLSHTDALSLEIDLTGRPGQLPDTYTGTLMIQAQEF
jgi:hypothetical protein